MRAAERERLTTWGWTDKAAGFAHMPIEAAIDRLAVPEPPPASPAPAPVRSRPRSLRTPMERRPPNPLPAAAHEGSAH